MALCWSDLPESGLVNLRSSLATRRACGSLDSSRARLCATSLAHLASNHSCIASRSSTSAAPEHPAEAFAIVWDERCRRIQTWLIQIRPQQVSSNVLSKVYKRSKIRFQVETNLYKRLSLRSLSVYALNDLLRFASQWFRITKKNIKIRECTSTSKLSFAMKSGEH